MSITTKVWFISLVILDTGSLWLGILMSVQERGVYIHGMAAHASYTLLLRHQSKMFCAGTRTSASASGPAPRIHCGVYYIQL